MWDQTARDQDGGGSGGSLAIRLRSSLDTGTRTIGASWVPNSLMNILAYLGRSWKHLWTALGSLQGVRGAREGDAARLVHHCAKLASDLHTVTADLLNSCFTIFTNERCHGMSFLLPACRWVRQRVKTHWALNTGCTQGAHNVSTD